jgi:hypothetical protein
MVSFNLETAAIVSTALGTAFLSVTGIRICNQRYCNTAKCDNGISVPFVDGWSRSGLQLGFTGVAIGNFFTVVTKVFK